MNRLILLLLLFFSPLLANKVIYLSYQELPQRVVKGEVFSVSVKLLSTLKIPHHIAYKFSHYYGLQVLTPKPKHRIDGKYFIENFDFLVTRSSARLPDITASVVISDAYKDPYMDEEYESSTLTGKRLNVITLNPKDNFSNIIANSFDLTAYKTNRFDQQHNIIVFSAEANNSNLASMKFGNVHKQGLESRNNSYQDAKITYFIVVNKKLERFRFSYFNLLQNDFVTLTIPIIVDDDTVSTQSDLKPVDQSKNRLKIIIASGVALFLALIIIWRRKYIYIVLILIPLAYIIYLSIPQKDVCIQKGAHIQLLPVHNGTIFETTKTKYLLKREGSIDGYVKVKLDNDMIGWVKNEDTCAY